MKKEDLQNQLLGYLIGLAKATEGNEFLLNEDTDELVLESLYAINNNLDINYLISLIKAVDEEKRRLIPKCYTCEASCGKNENYDIDDLKYLSLEIKDLKLEILNKLYPLVSDLIFLRSGHMAVETNILIVYKSLFAIGNDNFSKESLINILEDIKENKKNINELINNSYK